MSTHRFRQLMETPSPAGQPASGPPAMAFLVCPLMTLSPGWGNAPWQQLLYQIAYWQAQARQHAVACQQALAPSWN
jgi:hypothetical protein